MSDTFFTVDSFQTLAGCVASVVVIVSTTRHAFNWGPRWFGLVISVIVSFAAYNAIENTTPFSLTIFAIIVLNSCLIYTSAFGIQNTVIAPANDNSNLLIKANRSGGSKKKRTFSTRW